MPNKKGTKLFKVGDELTNNEGFVFKIVNYENAHNVTISWKLCGTKQICSSGNLVIGAVKYLNKRTVFGIGYLGYGRFVPGELRLGEGQQRMSKFIHRHWRHVLERTVSVNKQRRYEDCEVVTEWHNFQNFAEWAILQQNSSAAEENGRLYHLDKDMVKEGNRIYCPEYCVFLPNEVNCFHTNNEIGNTGYLGVNEIRGKKETYKTGYIARCHKGNVREYLGFYDTPEEAHSVYKEHKEKYAKELALKWQGKVDNRVIEYLEGFKVKS